MKTTSAIYLSVAALSTLGFGACASVPGSAPIAAKVDYVKQVQPFFAQYCYQCHGNGRSSGGVRLDVKASTMKHIKAGDPDNSDVYRAVTRSTGASDHMPPITQDQPGDSDLAMLKQWITEGAVWPDAPPGA